MTAPSVAAPAPLVEVEGLSIRFRHGSHVVREISFRLDRGECLALVGESGSGKSVTARALVGLVGDGAQVLARRIRFDGEDVTAFDARAWRRVRGARIGLVMQDAMGALDPLRTVGREIEEPLRLHGASRRSDRRARVIRLLEQVGVPEPGVRARQYPLQLSGGLRQRALLASAIACDPELLIADEPTTALDASVRDHALRLLASLRRPDNALLVISHDIAVVARLADRVAVMRNGEIVEQGTADDVLRSPQHPYTQSLLKSAAALGGGRASASQPRPARPAGTSEPAEVVVEAQGLTKSFRGPDGKPRAAVVGASLRLRAGTTLGIVGASGSGKTTLVRMLLGLEPPDSGQIGVRGRLWHRLTEAERRAERKHIQAVFQDPLGSFDPRYTVERVLGEAVEVSGPRSRTARRARSAELLRLVQLDERYLDRRPIEMSGGQRQRVAIARALAPEPETLICDEPVSSLDVSVQIQILDLLAHLKERLRLSCIFISHDLGVVRRVSDEVLVMKDGAVVESGAAEELFEHPRHPYTKALLGK